MKPKNKTYRVVVEKDGKGWHAYAPDLSGVRTGGRSIATITRGIREAIAAAEDIADDQIDAIAIDVEYKVSQAATRALAKSRKQEAEYEAALEKLGAQLAKARAAAVKALTAEGASTRDIAAIAGVSHTHVAALLHYQA